jgi:hypothetical protein
MQGVLEKVRREAAECLLLSNVTTDEKRELFAKLAGHLNDLAFEFEKTTATSRAELAHAADRELSAAKPEPIAAQGQALRWHPVFPWLSAVVFVAIAGAIIGTDFRAEELSSLAATQKDPEPSVDAVQSKPELSAAPALSDDTKQPVAALQQSLNDFQQALKDLQGERKLLSEQVGSLAARLDGLERARAEAGRPATGRRRTR